MRPVRGLPAHADGGDGAGGAGAAAVAVRDRLHRVHGRARQTEPVLLQVRHLPQLHQQEGRVREAAHTQGRVGGGRGGARGGGGRWCNRRDRRIGPVRRGRHADTGNERRRRREAGDEGGGARMQILLQSCCRQSGRVVRLMQRGPEPWA